MAHERLNVIYKVNTMTPRVDERGNPKTPSLYPPSPNPCPHCPARCCTHRVETSVPDAVRFCTTLCLPFHTAFELFPDGQRPFVIDAGPRIIALRRNKKRICQFLGQYGDELRCGVYDLRPATCRLYPFTFEIDDEMKLGPRNIRCPVPFGMTEKREDELRRAAKRAKDDWVLHMEIADAWAESGGANKSLDDFLRFAVERVHAADGETVDVKMSPLFWERSSSRRGLRMMVDHKVLR